jgi:hypothetical protein
MIDRPHAQPGVVGFAQPMTDRCSLLVVSVFVMPITNNMRVSAKDFCAAEKLASLNLAATRCEQLQARQKWLALTGHEGLLPFSNCRLPPRLPPYTAHVSTPSSK